MRTDPSRATFTRYFSGAEQDRLEREITSDVSLAFRRDRVRLAQEGLRRLRSFDSTKFSDTQRVSAAVLEWHLDTIIRGERYLDYAFPLHQFGGANVLLIDHLTVRHPVITERDAENYVAALAQVAPRMEEAIAEARRIAEKGIVPPRFILHATVKQMRAFRDLPVGDNPYVTVLVEKMRAVKGLPDARREELRTQAASIVESHVYPVWQRAITTLEAQLPRSTDDAGLSRLPGGRDAYAYALRRHTNTSLSPDEIHQIGLAQVQRIETEMDGLLRRLGRTEGSVTERIAKLRVDLRYPDPTSDASRAQIMRDIEDIVRDAEKRTQGLFGHRPKAPVIVQPFPAFGENNFAARYQPPTPDGSRPGVFQYPRRVEYMTKFGLRSVAYHETVPGHHFQIALNVENTELPRFRRLNIFPVINANAEGWGVYAEQLAAEAGWYEGDVEGLLGQLNQRLFRARRLVVDTGLHAKNWTRQQAIDYGVEASEVERYVVDPGQACSYLIGALKILELRDNARRSLGERFSLQDFHSAVLSPGLVPLEVLRREIDRYVAGGVATR